MKFSSIYGAELPSFEAALFSIYCPDGGLVVPHDLPNFGKDLLLSWAGLSYASLAKEMLRRLLSDVPPDLIDEAVEISYKDFDCPDVVKLQKLKDNLIVAEGWHGPTLSFKDLSASISAQVIDAYLKKNDERGVVIVATSGDTGSAAAHAVKNASNLGLALLIPTGRITHLQRLQMTTIGKENIQPLSFNLSNDELDEVVLLASSSPALAGVKLTSLNSVNVARILGQAVHYFYEYLQLAPNCDETVEFVIPTGGGGNVCAGALSQQMGLPIRIVIAVNANSELHELVQTGEMKVPTELCTLASAMDMQNPYNLPRLLAITSQGNFSDVKATLDEFARTGYRNLKLTNEQHAKLRSALFNSISVNDSEILETMRRCFAENSYLICPHTACAVKYHYDNPTTSKRVIFSTASPEKFPEAIKQAGGSLTNELVGRLDNLIGKKESCLEIEATKDKYVEILIETVKKLLSSN